MKTYKQIASELGELVEQKAVAYGDSMDAVEKMMAVLYPDGISPAQMPRALVLVRKLDKLKRYATDNDADGENPLIDDAGYSIRAIHRELQQKESTEPCASASDQAASEPRPEPAASADPNTSGKTTTSASARSATDSTSSSSERSSADSAGAATCSSPANTARNPSPSSAEVDLWRRRNLFQCCAVCGKHFSTTDALIVSDFVGVNRPGLTLLMASVWRHEECDLQSTRSEVRNAPLQ